MEHPDIDEVSMYFKKGRVCYKWRFPGRPYQYTWIDIPE